MGRIQGLTEVLLTGEDTLIKTGAGEIHQLTIAWNAAIGAQIVFRDGTTVAAAPFLVVTFPTAAGTLTLNFPQGKRFNTGLYVDAQVGGQVNIAMTYK